MPRADGSLTTSERGLGTEHQRNAKIVKARALGTPCPKCGLLMLATSHMDADHIVPRVLGGTSAMENLRALHRRCNRSSGATLGNRLRGARRKFRRAQIVNASRQW
jgi:5-methylcytosine-specific restriction endonuclease McrA